MGQRSKIIQIAAIAVAIAEHHDYGTTDPFNPDMYYGTAQVEAILADVLAERVRQFEKRGDQRHDPNTWLHILMEKVGEYAQQIHWPDPEKYRHVVVNTGKGSKKFLRKYVE